MKDNQMKQAEREAFEAWARDKGYLLEKLQDNAYTYEFSDTRNAWEGWKERAKLTTSQVSEPVAILRNTDDRYFVEFPSYTAIENIIDKSPLFLHPPTTPQEAISPAIAEYIKELETISTELKLSLEVERLYPDAISRFNDVLASKPTGLE